MLSPIRPFGIHDFPRRTQIVGGTGSLILDAANYARAIIYKPRKAITIKKITLDVSVVTSAMTNPMDCRIETVDTATAHPTGTLWAAGTNGTATITTTGLVTFTITNAASIGVDDIFAIVLRSPATGFGSVSFRSHQTGQFIGTNGIYYGTNTGAGWGYSGTFSSSTNNIMIGIEDASGGKVFLPTHFPFQGTIGSTSVSSSTTPDEVGNRFYLPYSCMISGFNGMVDLESGNLIKIYDDANNVLTSYTVDPNIRGAGTGGNCSYLFPANIPASRGWHRIVVAPTTTAGSGIQIAQFQSLADATNYTRDSVYKTSRTDGGAWTDELDKICYLSPEIAAVSVGGGNFGFVK